MRSARVGDHRCRQVSGVVGAERGDLGVAESLVQQRLIPGSLPKLGFRTGRPGRLGEVPDPASFVPVGKSADRWNEAGRVGPQLPHVGNGYVRVGRQPASWNLRSRNRDEGRLAAVDRRTQEFCDSGEILIAGAIKPGLVAESAIRRLVTHNKPLRVASRLLQQAISAVTGGIAELLPASSAPCRPWNHWPGPVPSRRITVYAAGPADAGFYYGQV